MGDLKEKYRAFRKWQKQPYQVAPLSKEAHDCATCGTHYEGNYCPRCGQSAKVGRYSFKQAFLLFLDVWGLGNRGMFRTIRDLMLRPGYMIRDYLNGMQMAYFPPFKMFFLVIAFSILVDSGLNIKGENRLQTTKEKIGRGLENGANIGDSISVKIMEKSQLQDSVSVKEKEEIETVGKYASKSSEIIKVIKEVFEWVMDHQTIVTLVWLLLFSAPLYLFFRHSPAMFDIRYSEFFVGMVYTNNMMNIIMAVGGILCLHEAFVESLCYLLSIIPLKQLSGYSFKRTFCYVALAFILLLICILVLIVAGAVLVGGFMAVKGEAIASAGLPVPYP